MIRKCNFVACRVWALLLISACLLCACGKKQAGPVTSQRDYAGFTMPGTHVSGGIPLEQANVRSLRGQKDGEDMRFTLSFVKGSRLSGSEEEQDLLTLPSYDVMLLETPSRLVIELPGLAYWDYTRTVDLAGLDGVQGYFQHMLTDGDAVTIYLQLRESYAMQLEEADNELTILLRPLEQEKAAEDDIADVTGGDTRYYVVADAYRDYCSGTISREMDMLPTLSADGERVVLISNPFDTPMEAESFMEKTLALTANALPAQWRVLELKNGTLPPYSEEMNYMAARAQNVARIDGVEQSAEVFLEDGLYLCTRPERDGVLYSKRVTTSEATGDVYTYELLYMTDLQGNKKRLFPYEFETIESARYAPDGRKLAVLERAAESTHLYVFDIAAKELLVDLTDVGFGDMISAFTWDALGSTLYAVSGTGAMQVHQYDFNVPDETKRYSVVDKNGADEGSIAYCDGELYFAQTDLKNGAVIYRIKPDGGVRKAFLAGSSFELSPDAKYMAVNASSGDFESTGEPGGFSLHDMETGETTLVTRDFSVYDFFWSREGGELYFFENRLSGGVSEDASSEATAGDADAAPVQDGFPYTLWRYDVATGEKKALLDLTTTSVFMSGISDEFYLCYMDVATMGESIRATYRLSATE